MKLRIVIYLIARSSLAVILNDQSNWRDLLNPKIATAARATPFCYRMSKRRLAIPCQTSNGRDIAAQKAASTASIFSDLKNSRLGLPAPVSPLRKNGLSMDLISSRNSGIASVKRTPTKESLRHITCAWRGMLLNSILKVAGT